MLARQWVRNGPTKGKWFLGPTGRPRPPGDGADRPDRGPRPARLPGGRPAPPRLLRDPAQDRPPGGAARASSTTSPSRRPGTPTAWERFTDLVKITRKVPEDELAKLVSPPSAVSCYAQCPTIYWWLSGRTIADDSLPVADLRPDGDLQPVRERGTARPRTRRRVPPDRAGLRRALPISSSQLREKLLERYAHVFDDILELEWRTAWVTPFYMQQSGGVGVEDAQSPGQGDHRLRGVPAVPGRPGRPPSGSSSRTCPLSGRSTPRRSRSVPRRGSFGPAARGSASSGGLTAFLAQKGLDPDGWPAALQAGRRRDLPRRAALPVGRGSRGPGPCRPGVVRPPPRGVRPAVAPPRTPGTPTPVGPRQSPALPGIWGVQDGIRRASAAGPRRLLRALPFQIDFARIGLTEDLLVVLPTGLGKTVIAALLERGAAPIGSREGAVPRPDPPARAATRDLVRPVAARRAAGGLHRDGRSPPSRGRVGRGRGGVLHARRSS